jgi:chemotaxis protein MotA
MFNRIDFISVAGLIVSIMAIIVGQLLEGGHIGSIMHLTPVFIVLGGTMGAVMLQTRLPAFILSIRMIKWVFLPPEIKTAEMIKEILGWSQIARKFGILELDSQVVKQKDPFCRKGLQMVVDGAEPETIRDDLGIEIAVYQEHYTQAAKVWEGAGGYAPTIGILGAVLGLIHVMENLADPSKLGSGIAVAFVATIYGVGSANMIFLPVATKLKNIVSQQAAFMELIIEGLCSLASGENPRLIEKKLDGFIIS